MTTTIRFWNEKDRRSHVEWRIWRSLIFLRWKVVTRCNNKDEENEFFLW